jgi:hypothetical protein
MLDEKPNLVDAVNVMLTGAVAEYTSSQYYAVVRKFFQFCRMEKAEFFEFFGGNNTGICSSKFHQWTAAGAFSHNHARPSHG